MQVLKYKWIFLILAATAIGLLIFSEVNSTQVKANRIISKIEAYRRSEGRLPDPTNHSLMVNLGFELRVGWYPDYESSDSINYRITITEGFDGPSKTYRSETKQWSDGYP